MTTVHTASLDTLGIHDIDQHLEDIPLEDQSLFHSLEKDLHSLTDDDLVTIIHNTDNELVTQDIIGVFYTRYSDLILAHAKHKLQSNEDAEDALQEIFIKITQGIKKFTKGSKLSTWIFSITRNHCLDFIRSQKRSRLRQHDIDYYFGSDTLTDHHDTHPLTNVMDNEDTLWEIIQHSDMSSVRKEALLLKFRDGLSIKAIMNELTISESAAKMRIDRGKKDLKKTLTALMEENH